MRTFIIRARKASTKDGKIRSSIGKKEHFEVVAHSVINAFFTASSFRTDVEVYIIFDSSSDFPRCLHLSGSEGLSLSGFHEEAVIQLVESALKNSKNLKKDESLNLAPGVKIFGFGFERLISNLAPTRSIYLLSPKGDDVRHLSLEADPVFILTDHLAMPKNTISGLKRIGVKSLSLGKIMLFASQCVVLLNHELDLRD